MNLRENLSRSKTAVNMMKAIIALTCAIFVAEVFNIYMYQNLYSANWIIDSILTIGIVVAIVGLIYFVVYILAIVYFIRWFRRAYFNLHTVVKYGLKYSEGWAAGAWFVPIFNFFGPYQIAKEMNEKTTQILIENNQEVDRALPRRIGLWWTLWVVSSIIASVSNQMEKASDIDILTIGAYIAAFSTLLSIAAGIVCIKYIQSYSKMETELIKIKHQGISNFADGNSEILDSTF